jgi:hypothetical protein
MSKLRYLIAIFTFIMLITMGASAKEQQKVQAPECTKYFETYEKHFAIPKGLLEKISHHESSTHPWTIHINHNKKSYFFKNKEAMVKYVSKLNDLGYQNIDIGCMQVNLSYHKSEFSKIEHIIEPEYNVYYAAKLLKNHYNQTGDWFRAVAHYHSKNDTGIDYANKVLR